MPFTEKRSIAICGVGLGMTFWYNVMTHQVETDENRGPASELLGPYATRLDAEHALAKAAQRTKAMDAQDKAWADDPNE